MSARDPVKRPPLFPRLLITVAVPKRDRKYIVHDLDSACVWTDNMSVKRNRMICYKIQILRAFVLSARVTS